MINNVHLMASKWLLLGLSGILVYAVCSGGCLESSRFGSSSDTQLSQAELEFQEGRNRPPTAKTLFAMAEILSTQGKDSECEFILKKIIRENPNFLPSYNSLAALQMRRVA